MIAVTVLMALYLQCTIQVEEQQKQLYNNEHIIDSLIQSNDSLILKVDTLLRQSEIWDFGIQRKTEFLISAMIHVESRNDDSAYCARENAVGCLQIRPCMLNDVNRILQKQGKDLQYTLEDRWDRIKSKEMFHVYCNYYNLTTLETMARAWNGGPRGASKNATVGYWRKVRDQLES
jgi:hypothetical protein